MYHKHNLIHRAILIFIGFVIALFLSEILMRIYYYKKMSDRTVVLAEETLIYTHKPSIKFTNKYGVEVEYNSLGFIGKEVKPKSSHVFRILTIGDSITEAGYLSEKERYANRVAWTLSERTGRHIELINAGMSGYNTWQEFELMRRRGLLVNPNLIVVGICLNDLVYKKPRLKKGLFGDIVENYRDGSKARFFDFIYQRSDLYKFLYDFISRMRRGMYGEEGYNRYLKGYNFDIKPRDFERWKKPFLNMISLAEEHKVKILFVIFPLENKIIKGESKSCSKLSDFFEENYVHYLDLIGDFKKQAKQEEPLFRKRDLTHPTALGHKIAAEAIASYILENNLLE